MNFVLSLSDLKNFFVDLIDNAISTVLILYNLLLLTVGVGGGSINFPSSSIGIKTKSSM